ncbi:MAG: hypothetical protein CME64_12205 [Halobacteriovoraceae bacterium]|nr:hypothetical protein [Halobacteriovoraceae bacterium]
MKKIVIILLSAGIFLAGNFLYERHQNNVSSTTPYPYIFQNDLYEDLDVDAPILIIGDRLGERLGSFSKLMAKRMSQNLSKPIKIQSIAQKGEGLHRTLKKLKSLKKLPLIIVYLGSSEEHYEKRFLTKEIPTIKKNLSLYSDDRVQSLLMIWPELSKYIYHPVDYVRFTRELVEDETEYNQLDVQKRNEITFKLFESEIEELITYAKDRNSYFLAISSPINLDIAPKSSCPGSFDESFRPKLNKVIELVKKKDFKLAYNISKDLALINNSNANSQFIHGKIAKKLGKNQEARQYLELAAAFDCKNWRSNPVYNSILKKAADKHDAAYFDLHGLLQDNANNGVVFMDDIYPQNLYLEKTANTIADRIKKLLKL